MKKEKLNLVINKSGILINKKIISAVLLSSVIFFILTCYVSYQFCFPMIVFLNFFIICCTLWFLINYFLIIKYNLIEKIEFEILNKQDVDQEDMEFDTVMKVN